MSMTRKIAAFGVLSLILTVITALALLVPPPGGGNARDAAHAESAAGGAAAAGADAAAAAGEPAGAGALGADPLAAGEFAAGDLAASEFAVSEFAVSEGDLTAAEAESKQYIIRNVSGYIGIYAADAPDRLLDVTDIPVAKLRAADARMLENGIAVTGSAALAGILEDFGS